MMPPGNTIEAKAQRVRLSLGMELPVIGGRGAATTDALVRAVRKGSLELTRAVAAEEASIDGAVMFCTPHLQHVGAANCARDVHLPSNRRPVEVLDGIASHFSRSGASCALLAPTAALFDEPWRIELERLGYEPRRQSLLLMGAASEPPDCPEEFQMISARAVASGYREFLRAQFPSGAGPRTAVEESAAGEVGFLDADALDVLVARQDGRIAGCIGAITVAEFGILRGLHVDPDSDRDQVTDALLWHVLDLAKRSQFRQIIAAVDESDTSTLAALARIGMTRIETMESYVRPGVEISP